MTAYTDAHEEAALRYLMRRATGDGWQVDALCKQVGNRLFYPELIEVERGESESVRAYSYKETHFDAVKVCALCPVMAECRAAALRTREPHGVWGGMTEQARGDIHDDPQAVRRALMDALNGVPPSVRKKKPKAGDPADDDESETEELEAA